MRRDIPQLIRDFFFSINRDFSWSKSKSLPVISRAKRKKERKRELASLLLLSAEYDLNNEISGENERFSLRHDLTLASLPEEKFKFFFRPNNYLDFVRLLRASSLPANINCNNGTCISRERALPVVL